MLGRVAATGGIIFLILIVAVPVFYLLGQVWFNA